MKPTFEEVIRKGLLNPTYESDIEKESVITNEGASRVRIIDTTKTAELKLVNGVTSYRDIIKAASVAGLDVSEVIAKLDKLVDSDGKILKSSLLETLTQ
ncbi:hypothetical protein D3C77_31100 [compost metagenome]